MSQQTSSEASAAAPAIAVGSAQDLASHLFERHHVEIFAYLHRMVVDREWAEDLAQETFLSAYRAADQIAGLQNPRAWLYRIATNLALNALRRKRRFAWLPWQWHEDRPASVNVADEVGRHALVEAALAALPPDYRAPLLLYSHYGFKVTEVTEALNLSEGAARMRLQRAREMFRKEYRKENQP
jgi:RNA polymerase sigma-70 factor, ECF subfamily